MGWSEWRFSGWCGVTSFFYGFAHVSSFHRVSCEVVLLPFDDYEAHEPASGTLLAHPHGEFLAVALAHWMATESQDGLVVYLGMGHDLKVAEADFALISCPVPGVGPYRCRMPGKLLGIQHTAQQTIRFSFGGERIFGIGFGHGSAFLRVENHSFELFPHWGCLGCEAAPLRAQPLFAFLRLGLRTGLDLIQLAKHVFETRALLSLRDTNLILSMPGSGLSYVRANLEMISKQPTRGLEWFYTRSQGMRRLA